MKTSSPQAIRQAKRPAAAACVIINQLATPGLGSIMAGHRIAGVGQLILALVGFVMIIGWFTQLALNSYRTAMGLSVQPAAYPWLGKIGGLLFLASWLWAWITSASLLRGARRQRGPDPPGVPPVLE